MRSGTRTNLFGEKFVFYAISRSSNLCFALLRSLVQKVFCVAGCESVPGVQMVPTVSR